MEKTKNMTEALIGIAIGLVAGAIRKDKVLPAKPSDGVGTPSPEAQEMASKEIERLRERLKAQDQRIEELNSRLQQSKREARSLEGDHDDIEEELDQTKKQLRRLKEEHTTALRDLAEYKEACELLNKELQELKQQH